MVLLDVRHERATRLLRTAPLLLWPRDMPRLRLMASATRGVFGCNGDPDA